jgi:DNA-binding NtrC family response regulator
MPHRRLRNYELQALHPLLKSLADESERVVGRWHQLYTDHGGENRALAEEEFSGIMLPLVRDSVAALLDSDYEGFGAIARELGERLAKRAVPFIEVILTLHLCQESIEASRAGEISPTVESAFARLCHFHATLVAEGYIQTERASLPVRVEVLEDDTGQLETAERRDFHGLLGASSAMQRIYDRAEAASRARGTVLIVGESGTGKELVARAIHRAGTNPDAPFVAVNCPAIPRDLIESELFGHKRGSFSGANVDYLGLFRAAEGGTLLLDEVTEMNLETQSKLLRALQERTVRPVGSIGEVAVNVRVIASTNRRPEQAVKMGLLRQDLYYRLQANVIEIPPLRERSEDIPQLTSHFIKIFNADAAPAVPVTGIAQDAMAALLRYPWPGNVRELSNTIESAITFGRSARIRFKDLPQSLRRNEPETALLAVGDTVHAEIQAAPVHQLTMLRPKPSTRPNASSSREFCKSPATTKPMRPNCCRYRARSSMPGWPNTVCWIGAGAPDAAAIFPPRPSFALRELTAPGPRTPGAVASLPRDSICLRNDMGIICWSIARTCTRRISVTWLRDFI